MRVSILTACTLTAWLLNHVGTAAQAQISPDDQNPEADAESDTVTNPLFEGMDADMELMVPSFSPPERLEPILFSPGTTDAMPLSPERFSESVNRVTNRIRQTSTQQTGMPLPTADPPSSQERPTAIAPSISPAALTPAFSSPAPTTTQPSPRPSASADRPQRGLSQRRIAEVNEVDQCIEQQLDAIAPTVLDISDAAVNDAAEMDDRRQRLAASPNLVECTEFNDGNATPQSGNTPPSESIQTSWPIPAILLSDSAPVAEEITPTVPGAAPYRSSTEPALIEPTAIEVEGIEQDVYPNLAPDVTIYRVPEAEYLRDIVEADSAATGSVEADLGVPPYSTGDTVIDEYEQGNGQGVNRPGAVDSDRTINITNAGNGMEERSPLEHHPTRLLNLETANQLDDNALQLTAGFHQPFSSNAPQNATGLQLYYGSLDWGITDDVQFGLSGQFYDDPPPDDIEGDFANIILGSVAPSLKYRIVDQEQFDLGIQGSVEWFALDYPAAGADDGIAERVIGSLHVPMTYTPTPELQLHLTPGISIYPGEINDNDSFGTTVSLGAGVSWQPTERFALYGNVNAPFGPGGNAIDSDDGDIERQLIWTVGGRYNLTPKVGVDLYATNGWGVTPATGILASAPDGGNALYGVRLNYTPDIGRGYGSRYGADRQEDWTDRDLQLVQDGFTLSTANTLPPGHFAFDAGGGTNDRFNVGVAYSPDEALQIEAMVEEFSSDSVIVSENVAGDNVKYAFGAQLQFLNQANGDPFSLSTRILGGRDTDDDRQIGTLFVDVPITYSVTPRTALFFNPRLAAFSNDEVFGVGFGVNHEVTRGLQLIGEVTPVVDESLVWAVGTRYRFPKAPISLDLYASNAAGRNGLGTLVGEDGASVGFNVNWLIGDR